MIMFDSLDEPSYRVVPRREMGRVLARRMAGGLLLVLAVAAFSASGFYSLSMPMGLAFILIAFLGLGLCFSPFVPQEVGKYLGTSIPSRPVVIVCDVLPRGSLVVELGGKRKLVLQLQTFLDRNDANNIWLDHLVSKLNRGVQAMLTTGGPNLHNQARERTLRHLLFFDLAENDDVETLRTYVVDIVTGFGITVEEATPTIFDSTVGHDWWFAHFYSQELQLRKPLSQLLSKGDDVDYTAILSISRDRGESEWIEVGLDLFVFASDKWRIWDWRRAVFMPRRAPYIRIPQQFRRMGLTLLRDAKLRYGAVLVEAPLQLMHSFRKESKISEIMKK